ncbi:MAG: response regulator transcription factor, partial [Polyangiaceae bacterium]
MRILVADDDPTFRELTAGILRERTPHEVLIASEGPKALQLALAAPTPFLLVLDWMMPKMTGTQLCRLVRAAPIDPQPHVLFITARARREEIVECMAAGADDLLTKPVAPDVLLSRVQLAARRWEAFGRGARAVQSALDDAAEEGDGELVVRSGNLCARVLFSKGMIAWAQVIDGTGSLLDALAPEGGIDTETAKLIVEECRNTGKSLTETLAAWGLVERSRLRSAMAGWIRRKIASICALPEPRTLFLPQKYKGAEDLLFAVSEVVDTELSPASLASSVVPETPPSLLPPKGWD